MAAESFNIWLKLVSDAHLHQFCEPLKSGLQQKDAQKHRERRGTFAFHNIWLEKVDQLLMLRATKKLLGQLSLAKAHLHNIENLQRGNQISRHGTNR